MTRPRREISAGKRPNGAAPAPLRRRLIWCEPVDWGDGFGWEPSTGAGLLGGNGRGSAGQGSSWRFWEEEPERGDGLKVQFFLWFVWSSSLGMEKSLGSMEEDEEDKRAGRVFFGFSLGTLLLLTCRQLAISKFRGLVAFSTAGRGRPFARSPITAVRHNAEPSPFFN